MRTPTKNILAIMITVLALVNFVSASELLTTVNGTITDVGGPCTSVGSSDVYSEDNGPGIYNCIITYTSGNDSLSMFLVYATSEIPVVTDENQSCMDACGGEGYATGYCNSFTVTPDAQLCLSGDDTSIGPSGTCSVAEGLTGVGATCCCTATTTTSTTTTSTTDTTTTEPSPPSGGGGGSNQDNADENLNQAKVLTVTPTTQAPPTTNAPVIVPPTIQASPEETTQTTLPQIPEVTTTTSTTSTSTTTVTLPVTQETGSSMSWWMWVIVLLFILILAILAYMGYKWSTKEAEVKPPV